MPCNVLQGSLGNLQRLGWYQCPRHRWWPSRRGPTPPLLVRCCCLDARVTLTRQPIALRWCSAAITFARCAIIVHCAGQIVRSAHEAGSDITCLRFSLSAQNMLTRGGGEHWSQMLCYDCVESLLLLALFEVLWLLGACGCRWYPKVVGLAQVQESPTHCRRPSLQLHQHSGMHIPSAGLCKWPSPASRSSKSLIACLLFNMHAVLL
jgi:hypothetical protein